MTDEQYAIMQTLVDEAYDQFVQIVCSGRKMEEDVVRTLADGRIYSAKQAAENHLIDKVGSFEEEKQAFAKEAKFSEDITYHTPNSGTDGFMSSLYGMLRDLKPETETELATDIVKNNGNGVLKYYAK